MACFNTLKAFKSLTRKTKGGKSVITFKLSEAGLEYENVQLPCGQCIGCRIDKAKDWAIRCVHEASMFQYNCFITLTFNDVNMNNLHSLVKADFQKFMKRFRKKYDGFQEVRNKEGSVSRPIRYFHCGEYGLELGRPHHHACIFNFDFIDKELWTIRNGVKLYRSKSLEELWPFGFCTVGEVTFESAQYVARYATKKITGEKKLLHYSRIDKSTGEVFQIEPEYITMSRRPGIGRIFYENYKADIYPKDFITNRGKKYRPPRYYDKIYDFESPSSYEEVKNKRREQVESSLDYNRSVRVDMRRKCKESIIKNNLRRFEND